MHLPLYIHTVVSVVIADIYKTYLMVFLWKLFPIRYFLVISIPAETPVLCFIYFPRFLPSDLHWGTQHQSLESLMGLSIFTVNDVVFRFTSGVFLSLITEYWIQNIHTIVFFGFIHEKSQVDYEESNTLFYIICTFLYRILRSWRQFNLIVNKKNWKWSCFFFSTLFNDMICV
jgi:hypothetical protein